MRQLLVTMGSFCLTTAVMLNAYHQKQQFYPSVVYLTKSSPSMAVLYLQAFVFVILMGKTMRKIFFGQLRAAEMEHLIERSWYAITETCLAFTVFRDDFSPRFVALFTVLLFLKCFHWLVEDRVDYMERSPVISFLFHARVILLLTFLCVLDGLFINHAYYSTVTRGASVQLVFGFEYAILLTIVVHVLSKYVLHSIDMQSENPWENKAVYLLYAELVLGFIKVVTYMLFLAIMIKVHTFPLFAIRPMYLTIRAFKKALNDVIMSRRAINNMNNLYPDATEQELVAGDNVCIICREDMVSSCKKLPCGHIFHTNCLRSWFQRQQTCPTCRMDILRNTAANGTRQNADQQRGQQQPFQQPPAAPNQAAAPGVVPPPPGSPAMPSAPASPAGMAFPGAMPPFMMPPFMMPMPFNVPPPMPPPDFSGLTEEELNALEGTERANVEARIQVLRNVQTLLDAAMLQMQQYTASARFSSQASYTRSASTAAAPPPATESTSTPNTADTEAATKATSDNVSENKDLSSVESKTEVKPSGTSTIDKDEHGAAEASGVTPPAPSSDPASTTLPEEEDSEMNEVRRRRLQRFGSNEQSSS